MVIKDTFEETKIEIRLFGFTFGCWSKYYIIYIYIYYKWFINLISIMIVFCRCYTLLFKYVYYIQYINQHQEFKTKC